MTRMDSLRVPPHSIDSEQAVLGGLLLNSAALTQIADWLGENDFYRKDHRLIYRAIRELHEKGKPVDAIMLAEWFETNGLAEMVGGAGYVIKLANSTPSSANVAAYAEIVREKARMRELIDLGTEIAGRAFEQRGGDASSIASEFGPRIASLVGDARAGGLQSVKGSVSKWFQTLHRRYESRTTMTGVGTPWPALDDLTQGLQPGDLIVIAGRSNMGKSVAGFSIALHNALVGGRTSLHSLEMRDEQFVQRSVAALAQVHHRSLRRPADLNDNDWPRITGALARISQAPLLVDDQAGLTAAQIIARTKREHLRAPLTLSVTDHLHAVKRPGRDQVQELGDITQQFKNLAKELHIPVVLIAQLNRANTQRGDHRPTMADLRGSGAIEEIADLIVLVHREDYYNRNTHLKGVVEFIIGKGRDVPTGEIVYLQNRYDEMRLDPWEGPLPTRSESKTRDPKGFTPPEDD